MFFFWRINGILDSLPNSCQNIESELIKKLLSDKQIAYLTNSDVKDIELLDMQPLVGSLSATDQFSANEMYRFLMNTYNIQRSVITGTEWFLGKLLNPQRLNSLISAKILDILVEYYKASYELMNFRKPFTADLDNFITVQGRIN